MTATEHSTNQLPHEFRRIRLELAREPGHPEGSRRDGCELIAPLDKTGQIDAALWRTHRANCRVRRFRSAQGEEIGHLVHRPGGSWAFHYDVLGDGDDEIGYRFENEKFQPGEYVSLKEGEKEHTFRVVSVERI